MLSSDTQHKVNTVRYHYCYVSHNVRHPPCTQSFSSITWFLISVLTCILTPINWKHIQSSNRQWCWGFNPNHCWGQWDFKFIVPWSAFAAIWCNEASSRWHTKCPYRVQRPALKVNNVPREIKYKVHYVLKNYSIISWSIIQNSGLTSKEDILVTSYTTTTAWTFR